jgi:hypothetical protein
MQGSEIIATAIAVGALLAAMVALFNWGRAVRIMRTKVLIHEMMKRWRISQADIKTASLDNEWLVAVSRCVRCVSQPACRLVLSESDSSHVPQKCPNRDFFDRVSNHRAGVAQS